MSGVTLTLSQAERAKIMKDAATMLAERLYEEHSEELQLVSKSRAAGLLDMDTRSLDGLRIPRVAFGTGKLVKYRLADIAKAIKANTEL